MAVVVASFLLAKPVRNALFLNEFGAYRLAYVFGDFQDRLVREDRRPLGDRLDVAAESKPFQKLKKPAGESSQRVEIRECGRVEAERFEERQASSADLDEILREIERGEAWELAVHPIDKFPQFPRMNIDWHRGFGFVVMAFEDEKSIGFYPILGTRCGKPEVPVELGGQALEKWPSELFVSRQMAAQALRTFLNSARQDPAFVWVANDAFDREVIWEDRAGRIAWERQQERTQK